MINKVLTYNQNKSILVIAIIALIIGTSLILSSLQLKFDVNYALNNSNDTFDSHYLVLHKHVSDLNVLSQTKNTFTNEEIEDLKKQPQITKVATFKSGNNFEVMAVMSMEGGNFPPFSTLAFFESIPAEFIDVEQQNWKWKKGDQNVPVILPNSFLDAYNFGIAQTMNTPQISKNFISSFKFKLNISGRGKQTSYYANIVGFSDRVNSILVPENFLDYLNDNYGTPLSNSTRVIISTDNPKNPELNKFFEENGYETNQELTKGSIMEKSISYVFPTLIFLGILVVLLSFIIFILYLFLIIDKNTKNISWLLLLGYQQKTIINKLFKPIVKLYVAVTILSLGILVLVKYSIIYPMIEQLDMSVNGSVHILSITTAIALFILWMGLTFISLISRVKKIS